MPIEIGSDTPAKVVPLAWLLGSWAGVGVMSRQGTQDVQFGQHAHFEHDGQDYVQYSSTCWELDSFGQPGRRLAAETGYWRVVPAADPEAAAKVAAGVDVEVTVAHPLGHVEMYAGRAVAGRIELATDVVARAEHASGYSAAKRLYGLVENELMWVAEEVVGQQLKPLASARLQRAEQP